MNPFRMQFSIRSLIFLTAAVAVTTAILQRIHAPEFAVAVFATYVLCLVVWMVMRGPSVLADLAETRRQRRKLKERRGELESELQELKRLRQPGD